MYMLLHEGEHPFYKLHHTYEKLEGILDYKLTLNKVKFRSGLSDLAINLFHYLAKLNPNSRYSANEALKHPWITRKFDTEIPMPLF